MYLERTKSWRKGENQLLLGTVALYKRLQTASVSRWIRETLALPGTDAAIFKAHSTRTTSISKASIIGVSTKEIMEAARWSNESTFPKFYHKLQLSSGSEFYSAIIGGFKQR